MWNITLALPLFLLPLHQLKTIHGMDLFHSFYRFKPSEKPEIAINHLMFFRWLTDGENTIVTPSEINPTPYVLTVDGYKMVKEGFHQTSFMNSK